MRAVVQRVSQARVEVAREVTGAIDHGLLVLLGVGPADIPATGRRLLEKIVQLRIFPDEQGRMNRSLAEVGGGLLVVSQFTLWGDCRKGRRPSFIGAAPPELAESLYEEFVAGARQLVSRVETGRFAADMQVHLVNDGPVTLWLDTDDWGR